MSTPGSGEGRDPQGTRILGKDGWTTLEEARAALPTGWSWRDRRDRRDRRRLWPWVAAGVALLVAVLLLRGGQPDTAPQEQQAFLAAVQRAQREVREGNDLTVVTARRERRQVVCGLLGPRREVQEWVGTVEHIGTTLGGDDGVLRVSLGHDVDLKTQGAGWGDDAGRTLIRPGSEVYDSLADLDEGDPVVFSGTFVPKGRSCLQETSVRDRNGILTPDFVFRFSSVRSN
jgi:hypothetical protein